jgi:ABC-type Fe3+-hydroxamate transport system substrate-binding protein
VTADSLPPKRIVSLVPSTTETVFALGAGDRVVGVTRFCIHPEEARTRARIVGGTKNPVIDRILDLEPDLVLANEEENRRDDVEALRARVPVLVSFPRSLRDAVRDIRSLGSVLGEPDRGEQLARDIERERSKLAPSPRSFRYLYLIWRRPYMAAGPGTFVDSFLGEAGGVNAAPTDRGRYPEITADEVGASDADVLLLSSEPFPFRDAHRSELAGRLPEDRILLVDGELLSWHGVRLREGVRYLLLLQSRIESGGT